MLTGFLVGLAVGFPLGAVTLFLWAVVDCTRSRHLVSYDPERDFEAIRARLRQKEQGR
jgi:hypothetical protein